MVEPSNVARNRVQPIALVQPDDRVPAAAAPPAPLTSFVGREREIDAILDILKSPYGHLLTLTGPGGVGKTRLALEVAMSATAAYDGMVFVDLSAVIDPALMLAAIARALGVIDVGPLPLLDRLATALGARHVLLVLDNFEQIASSGPDLNLLRRQCPEITIIVTSRVPLHIVGEHEFPVPPLETDEAARLFRERARSVRPAFELTSANEASVAAICQGLDGLPLAIELAAARTRVLSPEALRARLEHRLQLLTSGPHDAPDRQRTLRDAIAWSHDLLDTDEQHLFRQLAIFAGGFSLDAAEFVIPGDGETPGDLFERIVSLADKSLLRPIVPLDQELEIPRFAMLETVREFAREHLEASGELAPLSDRHAAWCIAFAERANAGVAGPDAVQWAQRMDREVPNLEAGLGWLIARNTTDDALRLAAAPWLYWMHQGRLGEGWGWLDRVLAVPGGDPLVRARTTAVAGLLASNRGDYAFTARVEEALAFARNTGDASCLALALFALGDIAGDRNDHELSTSYLEEARTLFDLMGDGTRATMSLANLGAVAWRNGDVAAADAYLEDAASRARSQGFGMALAVALNVLGRIARGRGDAARAYALYQESLGVAYQLGNRLSVAYILLDGGGLAAAAGHHERAARLWGAAEASRETIGLLREPSPAHAAGADYDRVLASIRARLGEQRFAAAWAAGRALPLDRVMDEAIWDDTPPGSRETDKVRRPGIDLSPRELDVLRLLAQGKTDKEIGEALFISWRTAQGHVASILGKLNVSTRAAAAAAAYRDGLIAEADDSPA